MKYLCCCSIAVCCLLNFESSFCVSAGATSGSAVHQTRAEQGIIKNPTNHKKRPKKDSIDQYGGAHFEVGFCIGHQKTSADSRDFAESPSTVNAVRYGGSVALGYSGRVSNNFYAGVSVGIDGTFGPSKMWRGGELSETSSIRLNNEAKAAHDSFRMSREFYRRRGVLSNLLRTVSEKVKVPEDSYLEEKYFKGAIDFCHWLGEGNGERPYSPFPDYLTEEGAKGIFGEIEKIGIEKGNEEGDPIEIGLTDLRDFSAEHFPNVSRALSTIAHNNYEVFSVDDGSLVDEDGNLEAGGTQIISNFFNGHPIDDNGIYYYAGGRRLENASQLFPRNTFPEDPACDDDDDITSDQKQLSYALKAINDLYYNTDDSDEELLKYRRAPADDDDASSGSGDEDQESSEKPYKFNSKTKFDLCPYVALQLGYYIKELGGILYTKLGAMQLNGRSTIASETANVYDEKFHRWTPYAAIGFNKSISEYWGVSVEVGHAFRTSKKFDIKYGKDTIKEKIAVSRTMFKVLFTCNLGNLMDL